MKKHSPNFFENLHEADTATNNRFSTFVWTLITVGLLLFGFSIASKAQKSADTTYVIPNYRLSGKNVSRDDFYKSIKFLGDTLLNLIPYTERMKRDTTPVYILATDTTISTHPLTIYGYQTEIQERIEENKEQGWYVTRPKTIYLNHLKQPLPERLIVWMAVRRKEK